VAFSSLDIPVVFKVVSWSVGGREEAEVDLCVDRGEFLEGLDSFRDCVESVGYVGAGTAFEDHPSSCSEDMDSPQGSLSAAKTE